MTYIHAIGTAVPQNSYTQEEALQEMLAVMTLSEVETRKMRIIYRSSGIDKRHTALPNFFENFRQATPPNVQDRMQWFQDYAPNLCLEAIKTCLPQNFDKQEVTHLITVTCTGLSAPGLDIEIINKLGLRTNIYRTSVNFMGCYAAFHALKHADLICQTDENATVLVVCVELCTLHLQLKADDDNTRANLLFSDGAAAAIVSRNDKYKTNNSLKINKFYADIVTKGDNDMAWHIAPSGFLMKLSAYIPQLVEENIEALLLSALQHTNISKETISQWAIHPGGKKIVENAAKALQLNDNQLTASYQTLKNYGNMSSATILFVLKEVLNETHNPEKPHIFAVGFGPGLTMESMLLER
jgi:predicted naringenin-chalcone synthase